MLEAMQLWCEDANSGVQATVKSDSGGRCAVLGGKASSERGMQHSAVQLAQWGVGWVLAGVRGWAANKAGAVPEQCGGLCGECRAL